MWAVLWILRLWVFKARLCVCSFNRHSLSGSWNISVNPPLSVSVCYWLCLTNVTDRVEILLGEIPLVSLDANLPQQSAWGMEEWVWGWGKELTLPALTANWFGEILWLDRSLSQSSFSCRGVIIGRFSEPEQSLFVFWASINSAAHFIYVEWKQKTSDFNKNTSFERTGYWEMLFNRWTLRHVSVFYIETRQVYLKLEV